MSRPPSSPRRPIPHTLLNLLYNPSYQSCMETRQGTSSTFYVIPNCPLSPVHIIRILTPSKSRHYTEEKLSMKACVLFFQQNSALGWHFCFTVRGIRVRIPATKLPILMFFWLCKGDGKKPHGRRRPRLTPSLPIDASLLVPPALSS
jgi:hypothetical protein